MFFVCVKVVGRKQTPRLSHREHMHYTNAVLHESLRMGCVVYNAVLHYAKEDIIVGKYTIPKGAIIIPSLMSVMLDPIYFSNPHEFNPDRFLDANGKFKPDEHVIAFSVGKRACLGQVLAEKELFLFFTGILNNFDINLSPNQSLPSYKIKDDQQATIVRSPPPFDLILTHR